MGQFEGADTVFVVQHSGKPAVVELLPAAEQASPAVVEITEPTVETNKPAIEMEAQTAEEAAIESAQASKDNVPLQDVKGVEKIAETDLADVIIKPENGSAKISITDKDAENIKVTVNNQPQTALKKNSGSDVWTGDLAMAEAARSNEPVLIQTEVTDERGKAVVKDVVWLSSDSSLQTMFALEKPDDAAKIFGLFSASDINKITHGFYAFLIFFLAGSLMLYMLIKMHVQKVTVIAHTLSVIGLALVLMFVF